MRLLFLITKSEIGGAQRFVEEQTVILKRNGYRTFLVTNEYGWLTEAVLNNVCEVAVHKGIESKFSLSFFVFLRRFIFRNSIDLVVCSSANAGLYGRVTTLFSNCKSIYVSHGWSSIYNGGKLAFLLNIVEKLLSIAGNSVLCISENDYVLALDRIGINKRKLFLLPNSILPNPKKSNFSRVEILKLVMVCRLDHPKRPDLMIKAVQKIDRPIELTIIGNGKQYPALKNLIGNEDKNIIFKGEVLGFNDFHLYDAFALISLSEGLPISAIEAMSHGLGLILSDVGGCPSLIDNNGVLVENTVDSIIEGLVELMNKIDLFKMNSLIRYNEHFNLEKNGPKYISYYKSVIS